MSTGMTLRLVTLAMVIALFYLCAKWAGPKNASYTREISEMYTTAAAILGLVLTHYECHWAWMGVTWGACARRWRSGNLSEAARPELSGARARAAALRAHARGEHRRHADLRHFTWRFITFTLMALFLPLRVLQWAARYPCGACLLRDSFVGRLRTRSRACLPGIVVVMDCRDVGALCTVVAHRGQSAEAHGAVFPGVPAVSGRSGAGADGEPVRDRSLPDVSARDVAPGDHRANGGAALLVVALGRQAEFGAAPIVAATYTGAGSALVWLLLLYELHSLNVAPGWAVFGLALFEVGYLRKFSNWRVQGYAIFASAFVRIFLENISASRHDLLVTTLPLAIIFYYAYWRLESRKRDFLTQDRQMLAGPILCYMGTAMRDPSLLLS